MATSRPVDNSVNERRLRPIYDWLDNGSNKKALQEAEKVLKKQPNLQCAKVLKALALIRLGRPDEAQVILKEVQKEEPYEDATLQAMAICFRETHQPELTCQVYESAVKKDPQNEEFLSHLFMSYVRVGDYRKQQQTAMALYKVKPKNPYYFWAVMSILMQSYGSNETVCLTVTLPLAERLVKKLIDENKIEAEAEVLLYLMVLERQHKYQEALDVVKSPLGEKLSAGVVETKEGEYNQQLKRWGRVMECFTALLSQNPDHWNYYVQYLEALFEHSASDAEAVGRAKEMILDLARQEKEKEKDKLRGPYLALIFFWQQFQSRNLDSLALLGDVRPFFQDYVAVFGDKPCAFLDLKPFIHNLPVDQVEEFLTYVEKSVGLEQDQSPTSVKQLCRHLLHLQLSRNLGRHESLDRQGKIQLSDQLWRHYENTKFLNEGLLPTDFRPNDGYALLAAHLLLDAWDHDSKILFKCLALLANALSNSPANYHLKLLTTRLYTLAGHGKAAYQLYETLDVKYIQLDSLGHLLSRPLISMGLPHAAAPILANTLKFYTTHAKETSECLIAAYKYGSFSKIPEFTQFSQKLDTSFHFTAVTTERMLLDLLEVNSHSKMVQMASSMSADPDKDQPKWDTLVDNRDLKIFVSWDPPSKQIDEKQTRETFKSEVQFARLRNRLLHTVIAALSVSPSWQSETQVKPFSEHSNGTEHGSGAGVLHRLLDELRSLLNEFKSESFLNHSQFSIQSPPPPRLYTYVGDGCLNPLLILLHILCQLHTNSAVSTDMAQDYERALKQVVQTAASAPDAQQAGFWRTYIRLERTYNALEVFGLCSLVLSTVHAVIKTNKNSCKKKKKTPSKSDQNGADSLVEVYSSLLEATKTNGRTMETVLSQLDLESAADLLAIADESSSSYFADIQTKLGHPPSTEMRAILVDKLKFLNACAL